MSLLLLFNQANQSLIEASRRLLAEGHPAPAVVVAQAAVETAMERGIETALRAASIDDALREWITRRDVRGMSYSPTNQRVQALWSSLTGDKLSSSDWWMPYCAGVELRDTFVHAGVDIAAADADAFIDAATAAVAHIGMRASDS